MTRPRFHFNWLRRALRLDQAKPDRPLPPLQTIKIKNGTQKLQLAVGKITAGVLLIASSHRRDVRDSNLFRSSSFPGDRDFTNFKGKR